MNFKYEKDEANKYLISNVINEKNYKLYKRKYNNFQYKIYIFESYVYLLYYITFKISKMK